MKIVHKVFRLDRTMRELTINRYEVPGNNLSEDEAAETIIRAQFNYPHDKFVIDKVYVTDEEYERIKGRNTLFLPT